MGWHEEEEIPTPKVVGPSRKPNVQTALAMAALMGGGIPSLFKTRTPKEPKMALTDEEKVKLTKLHGKAKKAYVNELKEKYDRTI